MLPWFVLVLALVGSAAAQWPNDWPPYNAKLRIDVQVPESGAVTFTSPGYPALLQPYTWIVYKFHAPPGRAIQFDKVYYGGSFDSLKFYEYPTGYVSGRFELGLFHANPFNNDPILDSLKSSLNAVFAEIMVGNASMLGWSPEGFVFTARSVSVCDYRDTILDVPVPVPIPNRSTSVSFYSPCFPFTYPNNINLTYTVHTEPGLQLQISPPYGFRTGEGEGSLTATEVLSDGQVVSYPITEKTDVFRSQTNKVAFTFLTDGAGVNKGFEVGARSVIRRPV